MLRPMCDLIHHLRNNQSSKLLLLCCFLTVQYQRGAVAEARDAARDRGARAEVRRRAGGGPARAPRAPLARAADTALPQETYQEGAYCLLPTAYSHAHTRLNSFTRASIRIYAFKNLYTQLN